MNNDFTAPDLRGDHRPEGDGMHVGSACFLHVGTGASLKLKRVGLVAIQARRPAALPNPRVSAGPVAPAAIRACTGMPLCHSTGDRRERLPIGAAAGARRCRGELILESFIDRAARFSGADPDPNHGAGGGWVSLAPRRLYGRPPRMAWTSSGRRSDAARSRTPLTYL
jgi:hypothetical protein